MRPARLAAICLLGACTAPKGSGDPADSADLAPAEVSRAPHACASPGPPGFTPAAWPGLIDASAANAPIQYGGGGLAVFDSDGDGRYEVFIPNAGPDQLWSFDPAVGMVDISDRFPGGEADATVGGVPADVDGDGDLDLFVINMRGPDRLLRNDGGVFSDMTEIAGVGGGAWDSVGASFADIDLDGDLDLFVARHRDEADLTDGMISGTMPAGHPSGLYLNRGDGTFEDASYRLPAALQDNGYPFAGLFHDLDRDGLPDLYVILDFGPMSSPNLVLLNDPDDPGVFTSAPADSSLADLAVEMYAMGVAPTDPDGDGRPDLAISDWGRILLLASDGEGGFYDASQASGLLPLTDGRMQAWGVEFADVDNDGDEDLFAAFSPLVMPPEIEELLGEELALANPPDQPDALYLRDGPAGSFAEVAAAWGVDQRTLTRGLALVDLDGDGHLDLLKRALDAPAALYRAACVGEGANALTVSLRQPGPNPYAIGAEIVVRTPGLAQWRGMRAGGTSFATGLPPEIHVGIGAETAAEIEIRWPDGAMSVVEAENGRIVIERIL